MLARQKRWLGNKKYYPLFLKTTKKARKIFILSTYPIDKTMLREARCCVCPGAVARVSDLTLRLPRSARHCPKG